MGCLIIGLSRASHLGEMGESREPPRASHPGETRSLKLYGAIVLCAALAGCRDLGVVTNTYATAVEARGAVERGWIPAFLPPGAQEIREAHDKAGDRRWGVFSFGREDDQMLRGQLGAELRFDGLHADAPPRIEWWPVLLRGSLDHDRLASTGLKGYPVAGQRLVVAVNWNQRRAYYWSLR
jgi:hypothetical protein